MKEGFPTTKIQLLHAGITQTWQAVLGFLEAFLWTGKTKTCLRRVEAKTTMIVVLSCKVPVHWLRDRNWRQWCPLLTLRSDHLMYTLKNFLIAARSIHLQQSIISNLQRTVYLHDPRRKTWILLQLHLFWSHVSCSAYAHTFHAFLFRKMEENSNHWAWH